MPKYVVTVAYTCKFEKEIAVYAKDETEADEKAVDIVLGWSNVEDAESTNIDEED